MSRTKPAFVLSETDLKLIEDAIAAGDIVLVTNDRVLRDGYERAGGKTMSGEEALAKAKADAEAEMKVAPTVARELELTELVALTPERARQLAYRADEAYTKLQKRVTGMDLLLARLIRKKRVEERFSWRAIAAFASENEGLDNQLVGMALCERAAMIMDEDYREAPWN